MGKELFVSVALGLAAISLALVPLGWPKMPYFWMVAARIAVFVLVGIIGLVSVIFVVSNIKRAKANKMLGSLLEEGQAAFNKQVHSDTELSAWKEGYRNWYDRTAAHVRARFGESGYAAFKSLVDLSDSRWKFQYNEDHRQHLNAFNGFLLNLRYLIGRMGNP